MTVAVGVGTVTAKGDMLVGAMAIGRMLAMTLDPAICDWEGGAWGLTAAGEVDIGLMLAVLGDSVTGAFDLSTGRALSALTLAAWRAVWG